MTDADEPLRLNSATRRKLLLATGGALTMGSLAGCTGEEGSGDGEDSGVPERPTGGNIAVEELDAVLRFLVLSADYQNKLLEREYGG